MQTTFSTMGPSQTQTAGIVTHAAAAAAAPTFPGSIGPHATAAAAAAKATTDENEA